MGGERSLCSIDREINLAKAFFAVARPSGNFLEAWRLAECLFLRVEESDRLGNAIDAQKTFRSLHTFRNAAVEVLHVALGVGEDDVQFVVGRLRDRVAQVSDGLFVTLERHQPVRFVGHCLHALLMLECRSFFFRELQQVVNFGRRLELGRSRLQDLHCLIELLVAQRLFGATKDLVLLRLFLFLLDRLLDDGEHGGERRLVGITRASGLEVVERGLGLLVVEQLSGAGYLLFHELPFLGGVAATLCHRLELYQATVVGKLGESFIGTPQGGRKIILIQGVRDGVGKALEFFATNFLLAAVGGQGHQFDQAGCAGVESLGLLQDFDCRGELARGNLFLCLLHQSLDSSLPPALLDLVGDLRSQCLGIGVRGIVFEGLVNFLERVRKIAGVMRGLRFLNASRCLSTRIFASVMESR